MPIANYQTPGVYVTQGANPIVNSISSTALNICFLGYVPSGNLPTNSQTDVFQYTVASGGSQTFTLTQSGTISNFTLTNNITGAPIVASGNYTGPTTVSGVTTFSTISGSTAFVQNQTWVSASYNYSTVVPGQTVTFTDFNSVQNLFGPAFTYTNGSPVINSPCTLAAYLAFQNGAQVVSLQNIVSSGGASADYLTAIQSFAGTHGIDVFVPLVYDSSALSGLFTGMAQFFNAQANNGIYQRGFIGMDSTVTDLIGTSSAITNTLFSPRMTLAAPNVMTYNPGINTTTGLTTGTVQIPGYYLAAALAGLFVGQTDVYVPITNKRVGGFTGVPNQITSANSTTLQSYGVTVVRQQTSGALVVRQGLTTDTTNWITQELSIQAIGDRLANILEDNLSNSNLIGSPLTNATLSALQSFVLAILNQQKANNLIQAFTTPTYSQDPNNLTRVNVAFQYSPTLPLNYINIAFSINTATGALQIV